MRKDSLPSPGMLSMGTALHTNLVKAVSAVELAAMTGAGGKTSLAKTLDNCLVAARTAIAGFIDAVVPGVSARTAGASFPSVIRIRTDKWLDPGFVPAGTAFAVTVQARTVTAVAIDGPDIILTLSAPLVAGAVSVAYTQPGAASNVRDLSGNLLASFTAAAVTNSIP